MQGLWSHCALTSTPTPADRLAGAEPPAGMGNDDKTEDNDLLYLERLPQDVRAWLGRALAPNERVSSCVLGDIAEDFKFGEQWAFLTNQRLLVLSPDGQPDEANVTLDLPLGSVEGARMLNHVASCSLVVDDADRAYEVVRYSFAARQEAANMCHRLQEIARLRRERLDASEAVPPPPVQRAHHRCPECGRAMREREAVCIHCADRKALFIRLLSYLAPYKAWALLGLSMTLIMAGLQLVPPYLTKVLVDDVFIGKNPDLLWTIVVLLVGIYIGRFIASGVRTYLLRWLGGAVLRDLRVQVFTHIQKLTLTYYNRKQTGQVMSRITRDIGRLQYFIAEGFQEILVNVATVVLIAAILAVLDWRLFLLALAPVPIIAIATFLVGERLHMLYHRIWRRMSAVSAILTDTIPGIRVVKAFAQEQRESRRFQNVSNELFYQELRVTRVSSWFFPSLDFATGLGTILIFSVGGYMALYGYTSLGVLMAFTGYMWRFYMPVQHFGMINHRLQHAVTSAERVFEILDQDPEPVHQRGGVRLDPFDGKVEFRDVRFSYEPGKYAIDGVSFAVEPGEMIGLVGPSGAGKSTTVHLIARFYEIDSGEILIDGVNVQDLDLTEYRERIGVVLQDPYLFHGTIAMNIAYSKPGASPDEIVAAARAANAHDFIVNLPDGYDSIVGERGMTLSGGERQRISIARAVLCDPRILILDEATASVDTETEVQIQTALERLVQSRTTFAIAHRLSTLRKANRLVVLDRGRIAEIGTHDELLKSGGLYSRLCKMQSELSKMTAWSEHAKA